MKLKNKTKFLLVFGIVFVAFLLFNTNNVQAATTAKGHIYKADTHEELNKKMGIDGEWYDFIYKYDDTYYSYLDYNQGLSNKRYELDVRLVYKNGLDLTKNINTEEMGGILGYYAENANIENKDIYLTFAIIDLNSKGEEGIDLGDCITIDGLGTFTKNYNAGCCIGEDGVEYIRYQCPGYQMKITDTSIFNNKYLGFDIEVKLDGMEKIITGLYQVSLLNKEEEKTDITIKNEDTDIKLDADTTVIPEDTTLETKEIKEEKTLNLIKESLKEISNKYVSYDITLKSNGVAIQPNGKVKISIPIPSGFDKTKLSVYRIADDGTKTKYDTKVEENIAIIETNHFSTYVLAENNIVVQPENTDKKEETPSTNNSQETTEPTQVTNKGEKDETPKTGTIEIISYVLVTTTIAGIGIVALKKKLK